MNTTNYIGAGVLLYAIKGNKLLFLLGKENKGNNPMRNNLYADFGGGREKGERPHETAYREFVEESMNAFGRNKYFRTKIKRNPTLIFEHSKYFEYVIKIDYNEDIPNTYNRLMESLNVCMEYRKYKKSKQLTIKSCPHGLLEKSEFKWFSKEEILNNKKMFRKDFHEMFKRMIISLESIERKKN